MNHLQYDSRFKNGHAPHLEKNRAAQKALKEQLEEQVLFSALQLECLA